MPKIFPILKKAYSYAKNHKFLWFFGFFLTGGGVFNFVRYIDFDSHALASQARGFWHFLSAHPVYFVLLTAAAVITIAVGFVLVGLSRAAIINAAVDLERKEIITFKSVLRKSAPKVFRVALISFVMNLAALIVLTWLFSPVYYLIIKGLDVRAFFLAIVALSIAFPLIVIFSLLNMFASCFVVAYDLKFRQSMRSAFDLISQFGDISAALFLVLFIVYFALFVFSASVLGLISLLALGLSYLLKSLSIPYFFIVLGPTSVLILVILVVINAALNVFTTMAWALFFLDMVKANKLPEEPEEPEEAVSAAEPAV